MREVDRPHAYARGLWVVVGGEVVARAKVLNLYRILKFSIQRSDWLKRLFQAEFSQYYFSFKQPGVTAPSRSVSGGEGKVAVRLHPGGLGAGCPQIVTCRPIRATPLILVLGYARLFLLNYFEV